MRVTTTLKQPRGGLLSDLLGEDMDARKLAFKQALQKSARGLEKDMEAGLTAGGLPKLAPLIASAAYPQREGVGSFRSLAVVYVKAGPAYQAAIRGALEGATIRANGGKYLAIPTEINRPSRQALGWSPRAMVESGAAFVVRRKNGPGLVWMLRVSAERGAGRKKGAVVSPTLARRATMRAGQVGAVPMFILIPEIVVRARMNLPGAIAKRFAEIEVRYEQEFERITHG